VSGAATDIYDHDASIGLNTASFWAIVTVDPIGGLSTLRHWRQNNYPRNYVNSARLHPRSRAVSLPSEEEVPRSARSRSGCPLRCSICAQRKAATSATPVTVSPPTWAARPMQAQQIAIAEGLRIALHDREDVRVSGRRVWRNSRRDGAGTTRAFHCASRTLRVIWTVRELPYRPAAVFLPHHRSDR